QAVRPAGAAGARARVDPPRRAAPQGRHPEGRRHRARSAHPSRHPGRARGGPEPARVRAARVPDAQRRPFGVPLPHRRSRLELPVRPRDQRGRRVRQLPAQEAQLRGPHGSDQDDPGRGLPARAGSRSVSELRLGTVLTRRFTRIAWTALAAYALLVVTVFAVTGEMALRRSLEHSADLTQSLLGAYRDSTSEPGGVMPSALADRLVAMGGQVVITRTTTGAGGKQEVYFVSADMPARRLEGLPASASPEDVRQALLVAIAQRARWRYRVLHRAAGAFDIYVVASRESYAVALGALAAAAALLLPVAGLAVARGARVTSCVRRSRTCARRCSGPPPRAAARRRRATRSPPWSVCSTRRRSSWKSCCSSPAARIASWRWRSPRST